MARTDIREKLDDPDDFMDEPFHALVEMGRFLMTDEYRERSNSMIEDMVRKHKTERDLSQ
jgi:hypothetical protein